MEQTAPLFIRTLKSLLLGLLLALGGAGLLMFLFAALLSLGIPDGFLPFFAHTAMLLAGVIGGIGAGIKRGDKGLLMGAATGIALFVLHLGVTLLWGSVSLSCLTYLAMELMGGCLGGILGVNLRK